MPRNNGAVARHRSHKRLFKAAKGFWGARKNRLRTVKETLLRAGQFAFRDRRTYKRTMRRLWITRISAACRQRGVSYSRFIRALDDADITLDRKILAELAVSDPFVFDQLLETAQVKSSA